jgi:hypothetical protein
MCFKTNKAGDFYRLPRLFNGSEYKRCKWKIAN